ncbi:MAG: hypothetical protein Q9208_002627 [Pyrenodesmia sp. 3 TL-2023]
MSDNEVPVATESPGLGELAEQIAKHAHALEKRGGHPPSNDTGSKLVQDEAYQRERAAILEKCRAVTERLVEPAQQLKEMALMDKHKLVALKFINRYSIANKVPTSGQTTFQALAHACSLPEDILTRILRQAMTHFIFHEPQPNHVAHTALSLVIPSQSPLLSYQLEIALPSTMNLLETLSASRVEGWEGEGKKAAFQTAHNTTDNFFSYAEKTGTWMETYGQYQSLIAQGGAHDISHLLNGYNWAELGEDAHVIDVGGGDGTTAIALANAYPNLHITVQDFAALASSFASKELPSSSSSSPNRPSVRFTAHSFFDPQPSPSSSSFLSTEDLDSTPKTVFLLRHILHDWPTAECQRILSHIVDAMRKETGARLVVAEQVMPREFDSAQQERLMRAQDMQMMVMYGSKEREMGDWEELFSSVGLRICSANKPKGSADTIMEVSLNE